MSDNENNSGLDGVIHPFLYNLDAMREAMEPLMVMSWLMHKKAKDEHLAILKKYGTLKEDNGDTKSFLIPFEHNRKVAKKKKRHSRSDRAIELLPRLVLISFVSEFDAYVGRLISALLRTKPELLNTSDRSLTFSELFEFKNMDQARDFLVEAEVESVLHKSHAEQFKWMEGKFSVPLTKGLDRWSVFVELAERRNLFVHTDGMVSTHYMKVCGRNQVDLSDVHVGMELGASKSYLIESYKCLYEFAVKLCQVLWRKVVPDELAEAERSLHSITFELLTEEKYELASRLLEFAVDVLPRHSSDVDRRIFIMNLAQSYLFKGDKAAALKRLDKEDWSACGANFQICLSVLREDFDRAAEQMKEIGKDGAVSKSDYSEWPIFKHFRESTEFQAAYKDVFGEEPVTEEQHERTEELELSVEKSGPAGLTSR